MQVHSVFYTMCTFLLQTTFIAPYIIPNDSLYILVFNISQGQYAYMVNMPGFNVIWN